MSKLLKRSRARLAQKMLRALRPVGSRQPFPVQTDAYTTCVHAVDCVRYSECLFVGAFADWQGMTCAYCKVYKEAINAADRGPDQQGDSSIGGNQG